MGSRAIHVSPLRRKKSQPWASELVRFDHGTFGQQPVSAEIIYALTVYTKTTATFFMRRRIGRTGENQRWDWIEEIFCAIAAGWGPDCRCFHTREPWLQPCLPE